MNTLRSNRLFFNVKAHSNILLLFQLEQATITTVRHLTLSLAVLTALAPGHVTALEIYATEVVGFEPRLSTFSHLCQLPLQVFCSHKTLNES